MRSTEGTIGCKGSCPSSQCLPEFDGDFKRSVLLMEQFLLAVPIWQVSGG